MQLEHVLQVYDARYATEYDGLYIENPEMLPSTLYQSALLKRLLADAGCWLDLACGTGFYLSIFDRVPRRCGLDISPNMLEVARLRNPDVELVQGNFLDANPTWTARWDVITCMWWAYCLVPSIHDIESLIRNMVDWLTPDGVVFMPLCNPRRFGGPLLGSSSTDPARPGVKLTGVLWSWSEGHDKVHAHMVTPFIETMCELFSQHFSQVDIVSAPLETVPAGYWSGDFLIAQRKR